MGPIWLWLLRRQYKQDLKYYREVAFEYTSMEAHEHYALLHALTEAKLYRLPKFWNPFAWFSEHDLWPEWSIDNS